MEENGANRVCPVEKAGSLDSRIRRLIQNPRKILDPFVKEGMTVVDLGCGPGFFTIDMAELVGITGRVIAVDLQEGMLKKLQWKIQSTELEERITLHQCAEDRIGIEDTVDFILAFYVVHEVPDHAALFAEAAALLRENGRVFVVEPPFHVSTKKFEKTLETARSAGFVVESRPRILFNKAAVLVKKPRG